MTRRTEHLTIEGMHCANCVETIEKAVRGLKGVERCQVNFATGKASIIFDSSSISLTQVAERIRSLGYPVFLEESRSPAKAMEFVMLSAAIVLVVPVLLMMAGVEFPITWQLALGTTAQLVLGGPFYISTLRSLRHGAINMDFLVVLGTTTAYLFSTLTWYFDAPYPMYFETAVAILSFVRIGRYLEGRAKRHTSSAIRALVKLQPRKARVEREGSFIEVPASEIKLGERFQVRAGERIPVDGEVEEGISAVDESMLSGESLPVAKEPGSRLFAATINAQGVLTAKATSVGDQTVLAGIIRTVEQAQTSKAPVQRLADQIASVFVPTIIAIAVLTGAIWWALGDVTMALVSACAVLVIACPCALGLATPTVIAVATGIAARKGILIRDAAALERTCKLTHMILDKTGTLTEGKPRIESVELKGNLSREQALAIAAGIEQHSTHPLARAIVESAAGLTLPHALQVQETAGRGIVGVIDGISYRVGAWKGDSEGDKSLIALYRDQVPLAIFSVVDPIRSTSKKLVEGLQQHHIEPYLLTGDRESVAQFVGRELGIKQIVAEVLPTDKAAIVVELRGQSRCVGMVGDGINDAPALAAADVGFAIGAGSQAAIEAAPITLIGTDPLAVLRAIRLSELAMRTIRQNLFFAFIYNVLAIPFAAMGYLNPAIAGAAMALSSITVVLNALLLSRTVRLTRNF